MDLFWNFWLGYNWSNWFLIVHFKLMGIVVEIFLSIKFNVVKILLFPIFFLLLFGRYFRFRNLMFDNFRFWLDNLFFSRLQMTRNWLIAWFIISWFFFLDSIFWLFFLRRVRIRNFYVLFYLRFLFSFILVFFFPLSDPIFLFRFFLFHFVPLLFNMLGIILWRLFHYSFTGCYMNEILFVRYRFLALFTGFGPWFTGS